MMDKLDLADDLAHLPLTSLIFGTQLAFDEWLAKLEEKRMRMICCDEILTEVYCQIVEHRCNVAYRDWIDTNKLVCHTIDHVDRLLLRKWFRRCTQRSNHLVVQWVSREMPHNLQLESNGLGWKYRAMIIELLSDSATRIFLWTFRCKEILAQVIVDDDWRVLRFNDAREWLRLPWLELCLYDGSTIRQDRSVWDRVGRVPVVRDRTFLIDADANVFSSCATNISDGSLKVEWITSTF